MGKKIASRNQEKQDSVDQEKNDTEEKKPSPVECGIVMPISEIDGCSADHWEQVREVIEEAIECDLIKPRLVSDADEVGIIHKRIVHNLYKNPIVVCDVSGKNPNVMFELGLRLAFDKPTVVIKDDETSYSFDTSPIEHIPYPRSLNYRDIVKFKKILKEKVLSTLAESEKDPNYSTFLGSYKITEVAEIETNEVSREEFYSNELEDIKNLLRKLLSNTDTADRAKYISDPSVMYSHGSAIQRPHIRIRELRNAIKDSIEELKVSDIEVTHKNIYTFLKKEFPSLCSQISTGVIKSEISVALFDKG